MDVNEKNPISHSYNHNEITQSEIVKRVVQHIQLQESALSSTIGNLEVSKRISPSEFIKFISSFNFQNTVSFHLIKDGIIHHFNKDYVASIHTLIPQIEVTLRALLVSKGIISLKLEKKAKDLMILENEFGGLLEDNKDEIKNYIGQNFFEYLKIKFVDQKGINLCFYTKCIFIILDEKYLVYTI
jgi:hypothetical protein